MALLYLCLIVVFAAVTGMDHVYTTVWNTMVYVFRTEGLTGGLYKGISLNWIKGPIAASITFCTFEAIQMHLRRYELFQTCDGNWLLRKLNYTVQCTWTQMRSSASLEHQADVSLWLVACSGGGGRSIVPPPPFGPTMNFLHIFVSFVSRLNSKIRVRRIQVTVHVFCWLKTASKCTQPPPPPHPLDTYGAPPLPYWNAKYATVENLELWLNVLRRNVICKVLCSCAQYIA